MSTDQNREQGFQTFKEIKLGTESRQLLREECPCLLHNQGGSGTATVLLPTDPKGGEVVKALVLAAQDLRLDPGASRAIYADDATSAGYVKQTDGKYINGDAVGEQVTLIYSALLDDWLALGQSDGAGGSGFTEIES